MKSYDRRFLGLLNVSMILLLMIFSFASHVPAKAAASTWSAMTSGTVNDLRAIWGTSASNVYAVGTNGTILHYNVADWSSMTSNTVNSLYGIWGSSATDIFAVGELGTIVHYDGTGWSTMTSNVNVVGPGSYLFDVWGTANNNVYAVGGDGINQYYTHYYGSVWAVTGHKDPNSFWGVWGSSANDIFMVGQNGTIAHYNGTTWSDQSYATTQDLDDVWGSSGSDVFAVTSTGTDHLYRYDGSIPWHQTSPGFGQCSDVWGTSSSDVFVVGHSGTIRHYNGSTWDDMDFATAQWLQGVWGSGSDDVFAVGASGTILHYGPPLSSDKSITAFTVSGQVGSTIIVDGTPGTVTLTMPYGTVITALVPTITHTGASISPASGVANNFTTPRTYTVTAADASTQAYTVTVNVAANSSIGTGAPTSHGSSVSAPTSPAPPVSLPNMVIQSASLSAKTVTPGTPITVTADIANKSAVNGNKKVTLYVNGQVETTQGITVNSGGSTKLTFNVSRSEPGDYIVYVDGVPAGSFKVELFSASDGILVFSAALVALAFLIGMVMLWRRQRTV